MQTELISKITNEKKDKALQKERDTEIFTDFSGSWVTPINKSKVNRIL